MSCKNEPISRTTRQDVLSRYLDEQGIDPAGISWIDDEEAVLSDGSRFIVLLEEEVIRRARKELVDTLWMVDPPFIEEVTGVHGLSAMVQSDQKERCAGSNSAIKGIIDRTVGIDKLVSEAIKRYGRATVVAGEGSSEVVVSRSVGDIECEFFIYKRP